MSRQKRTRKRANRRAPASAQPPAAPSAPDVQLLEAEPQAPTAGAQAAPPPAAPLQAPGRAAPVHATQTDAAPDEESSETDGAPPKRRKRGPRSAPQYRARVDQELFVAQVQKQIVAVRAAEPALAALLLEHGVTPEYLAALEAQLAATLATISARTDAIVAEQHAIKALEDCFAVALTSLTTMRQVARTVVTARSAYTGLHLREPVPRSYDLFVELARDALRAAREEPCASQLAAATYTPAFAERALAQIDALEAAIFARLYARTASTQAWMNRNRSVRELRRMVRPLHVQMRALLRHHPEFVTPAWF
ncbi:MAG: hypothetical protein KDE24_00460 [Caldilinea sp.]|nr:hypothetical protein [Caldilinea sp.]